MGYVVPGINIGRIPRVIIPWNEVFKGVLPLTFIGFMESYAVSHKVAKPRHELKRLDATQELWMCGTGNILNYFCSGMPSFGALITTNLANEAGAVTPFRCLVTLSVILVTLGGLTPYLYYIPISALAGIVFAFVVNLIDISDFFECYKHSTGDCITLVVTFIVVLVFDVGLGLAVGVGCSLLMLLKDIGSYG